MRDGGAVVSRQLLIVVISCCFSACYSFIQTENEYVNPVVLSNHPDPGVLALPDGSGFVAVTTSDHSERGQPTFPILFSANLVNWTQVGYVFDSTNWPIWGCSDAWAPELHHVEGRFLVYFSMQHTETRSHAIGVAISSSSALGPFTDYGTPLVEHPSGTIDVHWFKDPKSGESYLLWKQDSIPSAIVMRQMMPDGLHFAEGSRAQVLLVSTLLWDFEVVEAPWLLYREPYYYLFFSSNTFESPHYHVEVARSLSGPTGPYTRNSRGNAVIEFDMQRYLHNNVTFVAPGHCSVVRAGSDFWLVYHAWHYKQIGQNPPGRMMLIDKIRWDDDEWPVVGYPSDTAMSAPSVNTWQQYPEVILVF